MAGYCNDEIHNSTFIIAVSTEAQNMKTLIRFIMALAMATTAAPTLAGSLDGPGTAPALGSGMPTLSDIYNRLATGAAISIPGTFQEPTGGPTGGTGRSLADIQGVLPPASGAANAAGVGDVLFGKTYWGLGTAGGWGFLTGTVAAGGNITGANGLLVVPIPDALYSGSKTATATDSNLAAGNIKSGTAIFGVSGTVIQATGNATAANVLSTYTFSNATASGLTGSMADNGTANFTPGASAVPVPAGYYSGGQVNTDANLVSGNIRSGASIFGVNGTLAGYTCATGSLSPLSRWCDNGNGTVRDMATGLIWLKDAGWFLAPVWGTAQFRAAGVYSGEPTSLTDGSEQGAWRLPTKSELVALTTGTEYIRSSAMYKFTNVQAFVYYSSSRALSGTDLNAWTVNMSDGYVNFGSEEGAGYVWPVRSGQ
jgi:hypothetical protein